MQIAPVSSQLRTGRWLWATVAALIAGMGAVSVVVFPAQVAGAATDTVTTCAGSGAGSLPAVIAAAAAGDTVTFATGLSCPPASPITLTGTITLGRSLTISGPGTTTMAVSGANAFTVFTVSSGAVASISGLTIENGAGTNSNSYSFTGGGIENAGTLTLTDSTVSANSASGFLVGTGGGIDNSGTLNVIGSTVSGNTVGGDPMYGAIQGGGINSYGTLNLTNSTVSGNSAYEGGGIFNGGTANLTNTTVAGNSASGLYGGYGGGLYNAGTLVVTSSTVAGNTGAFGAGIEGNAELGSTIVAGNTGVDCALGTYTDQGYNLSDDVSCGFTTAAHDLPSTIPLLGALQNNGGPTDTMALQAGSPAIDHVTVASLCPATDQRGVARRIPCDIGAYDTDSHTRPAGYKIVASAHVTAPGVQTTAKVACPAGTSPIGGGVHSAASNGFALNSSYPQGADWVVTVSYSGAALAFQTFAVCIRQPTTIFTKTAIPFSIPANSQAQGLYNCPAGVEVGEGVATSSTSTAVTVNTLGNGETTAQVLASVNNPTATSVAATLVAICAKTAPAGYSVQISAPVADPPGGLANAHVACPGFSVPLSGGLFSPDGTGLQQFVSNTVFLGSTTNPTGWGANMANNDSVGATVWTTITCAGV